MRNCRKRGDRARTHHGHAPGLLVDHLDDVCGAGVEEEVARAFSDVQLGLQGGVSLGVRGEGAPVGHAQVAWWQGKESIPEHWGGCRWSPPPGSPSRLPPG